MRYNSEQFKGETIRSKRKDKQKERRLQERYLFRAEPKIQETKNDVGKQAEKEGKLSIGGLERLEEKDIDKLLKPVFGELKEVEDVETQKAGKDINAAEAKREQFETEVDNSIRQVINNYRNGLIQVRVIKDLGSELRKRMPTKAGYDWQQRDAAVEKLFSILGEEEARSRARREMPPKIEKALPKKDEAAEMGSEKKISHQEAQLRRVEMADKEINKYFIQGTMEPKKSLKEMESERAGRAREEINNTLSDAEMYGREELIEELKERYLALWGERSKILGESGTDRTGRFRNVERKIGEVEKEFARLGMKIDLFKWIGEKEEGVKRVVEEEKKEETKEKLVAEEVKAEKTAEQILEEMGVKINIEDIEGEIKYEIRDETVKIEFENQQAVEELLNKLNFNANEKEILKNNIGITLNSALDAEAEREFSRLWKHNKKVLAAGFAVSALAGMCSAGARMLGGGMVMKAGKIAGGVILGGAAGALRGKISEWMNPAIEKIKKNNANKLANIRQEKSKELFNENNLKTVAVQEIRRALLNKFAKGEENIFDSKNNALEFIKNNKELSKLQPEEREELANGIAVLAGIMNENSKRLGKLLEIKPKKGMSEIKRSALLGATIGGSIGVAQSISDNPYMPAIAAGAIGGIMAGRAIDIVWAKKEIKKKTEKIIKEIETMDLAEEGLSDELSKLKSYLESGILDKYPLIREKAKRMLIDELIKPAKEINEVEVDNQIKRLKKEFTRSKTKKILSYAVGIGGSMAIGAAGRFIFEKAYNLIKPESSTDDKEFLKELENLPKADKEYIAEHGLEKFMSENYLKDKLPFKPLEYVEEPETAGVKGMISEQFADVKIKGKTDTFSEAIYEAAKKSDAKTQENFIHKVLGDKVKVEDGNKSELLSRAVRKLSIANLEKVDSNIQNRLHEGNIVRLKSDGSWEELKGEGIKVPSAVKEDVLRGYAEKMHAVEAASGEQVRHIDLSEITDDKSGNAEAAEAARAEEAIAGFKTEYGITEEIMEKLKINPRDGLSADEGDKLLHLMNHKNNLEQAAESIKMVEGANVSYDDAYEYFYQFKNVSGNPGRMEGIVEILKHHDYKSGLSKIFGMAVIEKNFEFKNGVCRIKDFKPGFDYVVKIDGGEMKFGVDGPLGQWNWGARGRTWRVYIDADLTNENLEKSKSEVENMLKIFEKRR
jgi:hypothetical protein